MRRWARRQAVRARAWRQEPGHRLLMARERFWARWAKALPAAARKAVVVDAALEARRMYPDPSGYCGPDGLSYAHLWDGAARECCEARKFDGHHGLMRQVPVQGSAYVYDSEATLPGVDFEVGP